MSDPLELALAYISIVPSIRGLQGELETALGPAQAEATKAGAKAGTGFSNEFSAAVTRSGASVAKLNASLKPLQAGVTAVADKTKLIGTGLQGAATTGSAASEKLGAALKSVSEQVAGLSEKTKAIGVGMESAATTGTTALDRLQAAATLAGVRASEAMAKYEAAQVKAGTNPALVEGLVKFEAEATIAVARAEDALKLYAATAETSGAEAGAGLSRGMNAGLAEAEGRMAKTRELVKGLAGGLVAGLAITGGIDFMKEAVNAAKDGAAGLRLVKNQFGDAAEGVLKFGEEAANALGMPAAEADKAAAKMGNFLQAFKIGGEQAAKISEDLISRAADVGKSTGNDPAAVLAAMQTALKGRATAMLQYGVDVKSAQIAEEAYTHGIAAQGAKLNDTQKALATYYAIMDQSASKAGAFARSSNSIGTSQQILKANLENLADRVGKAVLPILATLSKMVVSTVIPALDLIFKTVQPVLNAFQSLPKPIQQIAAALGILMLLDGPIVRMWKGFGTALSAFRLQMAETKAAALVNGEEMSTFGAATQTAGSKLGNFAKKLGPGGALAIGIGAALFIVDQWGQAEQKVKDITDSLAGSTDTLAKSLVDSKGAWTANTETALEASVQGTDQFKRLLASGVDYGDAMDLVTGKTKDASKVLREIDHGKPTFDDYDLWQYAAGLGGIKTAAHLSAAEQIVWNNAQKDGGSTISKLTGTVKTYWDAITGGVGKVAAAVIAKPTHTWAEMVEANAKRVVAAVAGVPNMISHMNVPKVMYYANGSDLNMMSLDIKHVGDVASTAAMGVQDLQIHIDALTGRDVALQDATKNMNDQIRNIAASFKTATQATKGHVESLVDVHGVIDTTTQAGSDLYASVQTYSDAYNTSVKAAQNAAGAHATVAQKMAAAQGAADKSRTSFLNAAAAQGINAETAARMADQMGILAGTSLTPKVLQLTAQDDATKILKSVQAAADKAAAAKTVKFHADAQDAMAIFTAWNGHIGLLPTDVHTKFTADVKTAEANGQRLYDQYNASTKTWTAEFMTTGDAAAKAKAGAVLKQYNTVTGTWNAKLTATDAATAKVTALDTLLKGIKNKTVNLEVMQTVANADINSRNDAAQGARSAHGNAGGVATGGLIRGPGTGTSDSIPLWLSDKEFVNTAAATAIPSNRRAFEYANAGGTIPGFATGGLVTRSNLGVQMDNVGNDGPAVLQTVSTFENSVIAQVNAANKKTEAAIAAAKAAMAQSASGLMGSQDPSAWGWQVGANIVPYSFNGVGFPSGVASGTAPLWNALLTALTPMISGGIKPGEDWGYENRDNVNSPGMKSFHSYGLALDVNSGENPNGGGSGGNGPFQVPAAAGPMAARLNILWGGNFTGTTDPMHFELHESAAQVAGGSLASTAAGLVGAIGGGSGTAPIQGGPQVARWRGLADKVYQDKGYPVSLDYVLLNQMAHESSGDPNAIQLTDINAQEGHPSVGLLQFIPTTFAANADPGYNTNIYDPESQMHAFLNYVSRNYGGLLNFAKRNYGAYADGGLVRGGGTGSSDSILARVSDREYISTASAASIPGNRAAFEYANAGGTIPGFAAGGPVQASLLSGITPPPPGTGRIANVIQAWTDLSTVIQNARALATQMAQTAAADGQTLAAARQNLVGVRTSQTAAVASAEAALAAARKKGSAAAITAAQDHLKAAQVTEAARITSAQRAVNAARDAQIRDTAAAKLDAARATGAERLYAAQSKQETSMRLLGIRYDAVTAKLANAQQRVTDLQAQSAQVNQSITASAQAFGGGITGNSAQRTSFAAILQGQQYNAANVRRIDALAKNLRAKGLDNKSLQDAVTAAEGGDSTTLNALSTASKAQIKQLNATTHSVSWWAGDTGKTVADAGYATGIAVAQGVVKGLQSQQAAINAQMNRLAAEMAAAMKRALGIKSPSSVFHNEVGIPIAAGVISGMQSQHDKVSDASARLVKVPTVGYMDGSPGTATTPRHGVTVEAIREAMAGMEFKMDPQGLARLTRRGNQLLGARG